MWTRFSSTASETLSAIYTTALPGEFQRPPACFAPSPSRRALEARQTRNTRRGIYDGMFCSMRVSIRSTVFAPSLSSKTSSGERPPRSGNGVANQWAAFCSSPKTATACAAIGSTRPARSLLILVLRTGEDGFGDFCVRESPVLANSAKRALARDLSSRNCVSVSPIWAQISSGDRSKRKKLTSISRSRLGMVLSTRFTIFVRRSAISAHVFSDAVSLSRCGAAIVARASPTASCSASARDCRRWLDSMSCPAVLRVVSLTVRLAILNHTGRLAFQIALRRAATAAKRLSRVRIRRQRRAIPTSHLHDGEKVRAAYP